MRNSCLNICDEILLHKLECFIYDYSGLEYNNMEIVSNYFIGNRKDMEKSRNRDNVYKLREILTYFSSDEHLEEKELENAIDLFLLFIRTYSIEADLSLNSLLDAIWKTGKAGAEWSCIKRITGILASVYLLYFSTEPKLFDKLETDNYMKEIFRRNLGFYTVEDIQFLIQIFMLEKQYECLIEILQFDLKVCGNNEICTVESQYLVAKKFFKILYRMQNTRKYIEAMNFYQKSESLFRIITDKDIKKRWEKEKASLLFSLGKYEEAQIIQDKYIDEFEQSKNIYDLYNGAVYYAWAADNKEKGDTNWEIYIEKAHQLILKAEKFILESNDYQFQQYKEFLDCVILEKAFLLSEKGDYDSAFECFDEVFSRADKETKIESNFQTHLWILMKYMCMHPDKHKKVTDWIEYLYENFSHKKFKEYETILDFVYSNQYLKDNTELYTEIYISLLELLFHALEIRHETKVRDVSKYDILYYTKAEHLRLLLEDETSEKCNYRLPMFHVYHMNDPQEGKILENILGKEKFVTGLTKETIDSRSQYEENYVFLKSFFCYPKDSRKTCVKEFLPMWVQYGDDAKGCCVILDNQTFQAGDLRRIVYLSENGECDSEDYVIKSFLDKFINTYQKLVVFCNQKIDLNLESGKECLFGIEYLTQYIISQIAYLFKNESYKHENEVRLIINRTSSELDDVKVIHGNVPKVYIYNDRQTFINEVILGAKMENPEDYVSFLYKQGNKMWDNDTKSQIKVTQSTIHYR